jgi:hypothetical protein
MAGWSEKRFVVLGQNDMTCMVSPAMFRELFLEDNVECCRHVEHTIYHLDGPGAIGHLDAVLGIEELTGVQWVPGDGNWPIQKWLPLLKRIQAAGKCLHISVDPEEVSGLLAELRPEGLMICSWARTRVEADELVKAAEKKLRRRRGAGS